MFHMIGHIIFGLIVGAAAIFLFPGPHPGGWIAMVVLGMGGALVGGWLGRAMGWYRPGHPAGFFMALLGALLLLVAYTWWTGGHRVHVPRLSQATPRNVLLGRTC
jgi:uncharacterized membrane protein YeaQ/YmgE (transglycosylase-associated protein family)